MHISFRSHPGFSPPPPSARRRPSRNHPRSGQALLLSVLLMVFVALLAATFVTVVALNMSQTARTVDKNRARQAAQSGVDYVNDQLTNSPSGRAWFRDTAKATAPGYGGTIFPDANSNYYTNFMRANGWAGSYLRFPDPTRPSLTDSPSFLAQVTTVAASDDDNPGGGRTGQTRIRVIGLSEDDPAAFSFSVAYKSAPAQNPFAGSMIAVGNNALEGKGQYPSGTLVLSSIGAGATTLVIQLKDVTGVFPNPTQAGSYAVNIGALQGTPALPAKIVTTTATALAASPTKLTVSDDNIADLQTFVAARTAVGIPIYVEMAAPLGAQLNVTDVANGAVEPVSFNVSRLASTTTPGVAPGGIRVNGGLALFGNLFSNALLSQDQSSSAGTAASISASGTFSTARVASLNTAGDPGSYVVGDMVSTATKSVSGSFTVGGASTSITNGPLLSSTEANFPLQYKNGNTSPTTATERTSLDSIIKDGFNRLTKQNTVLSPTRQTQSFLPPDITAGTQGGAFSRYLELSKFSPSIAGVAGASVYGYGQGIYVDNSEDIETVYDSSVASTFRPMTQKELVQMWMSPKNTAVAALPFERTGTPGVTNASLEERHLRGWVGPDEFRAPGALVELDPTTKQVFITRDFRSDKFPNGSNPDKGWLNTDGSRLGGTNTGGVYRQAFPWPANGVIYLAGNARVRNVARVYPTAGPASPVNPGNSITIVSMGNIYAEGGINAGQGKTAGDYTIGNGYKVLLLALKNVVANPTALMQRVDAQTLLSNTATATNSIKVYDPTVFQAGDWIQVGATATSTACITNIASDGTLTLSGNVTGAQNDVVQAKTDPLNRVTKAPYTGTHNRLDDYDQVLQRHFRSTVGMATRVALRDAAARIPAINIKYVDGTNAPTSAILGHEANTPLAAGTPQPATADLARRYTEVVTGTNPPDIFPTQAPTPMPYTATNLKTEMEGKRPTPSDPADPWGYEVTVPAPNSTNYTIPGYTAMDLDYQNLQTSGLATVGNRYDFDATAAVQADPTQWRPDLTSPAADNYTIPAALSLVATMNGMTSTFAGTVGRAVIPATAAALTFDQLGYNPDPVTSTNKTQDVLTSDESFYTRDPLKPSATDPANLDSNMRYTLDSRVLSNTQVGDNTLAMHFNDAVRSSYNLATAPMPFYNLSRMKLDQVKFNATTGAYEGVQPGASMDIYAYVYAQQGSWFVIPGDYYDNAIKKMNATDVTAATLPVGSTGYYNDVNDDGVANAGEYLKVTRGATMFAFPDLDRDGAIESAEESAFYRFHRYNYKITFTGAILENQSALVTGVGTGTAPTDVAAPVSTWTDRWATITHDTTNMTTPVQPDTITYNFDDSFARDTTGSYLNDAGFQYPVSSELLYRQ